MAISLGTKLLPRGSKFSIGTQFELTTDDPMSQFLLEGKKVSATSTLYLQLRGELDDQFLSNLKSKSSEQKV